MGKIKIDSSIIEQTKSGNKEAIKKMFQTFLAEDENVISVEYLGSYGVFFTTKKFCLHYGQKSCFHGIWSFW